MSYKIVRYFKNQNSKVMFTGLTLEEAQEHCRDPKTHGKDWFDGWTKE